MESRLIEYLGGAAELEKKAPRVLKLLQQTVSHQDETHFHIGYGAVEDKASRTGAEYTVSTALTEGSEAADDTFRIYLSVDELLGSDRGVQALLRSVFDKKQKILVILTKIYDMADNRLIDSKGMYFEDTVYGEYNIVSNSAYAKQCAKDGLRIEASFTWSEDGETAKEQTVVFIVDEFMDGKNIISNIQVKDPRAKDGKQTNVLYDRESFVGEKTDYHYTNVVQSDGTVKLRMPFAGKVTVEDELEIQGIMTEVEDEKPKLCLLLENGCGAEYSNKISFADQLIISDDKKSISWNLDDDWNARLDLSHFSVSTILDLTCTFTLKVINPDVPAIVFHPVITVNSVENPQPYEEGSGAFQIEKIRIQWGCLAADTKITMQDGSQKLISDIVVGDTVRTESGYTVVTNIYQGMENELAHLVTENGHVLRMTGSHPIKTIRGFVRASELTAADTIVTMEGNSRVKYLYGEPYGHEVYNLELEQSEAIFCNDIIAGDFTMQNEMGMEQSQISVPDQPTELQSEFRKLFQEIS